MPVPLILGCLVWCEKIDDIEKMIATFLYIFLRLYNFCVVMCHLQLKNILVFEITRYKLEKMNGFIYKKLPDEQNRFTCRLQLQFFYLLSHWVNLMNCLQDVSVFVCRWSATAATKGAGGGAVIVQSRLFHRQKVTPVQEFSTCTKMSPHTSGEKESCPSVVVSSNKSSSSVIFLFH